MKNDFLKLSTVVLLLFFIGAGCQKDEIEYADESIEIKVGPSGLELSLYKTKGDYFNYISFQLLDDGRLNATPAFTLKSLEEPFREPSLKRDKKGKIVPNFRWRLKDGYILSFGTYITNRVFANITFQEFVDYTDKNNTGSWPDELLERRIIDKDPFEQFYYLSRYGRSPIVLTVGEINKMIEEGTQKVFKKVK
jgi:hypothetical protein